MFLIYFIIAGIMCSLLWFTVVNFILRYTVTINGSPLKKLISMARVSLLCRSLVYGGICMYSVIICLGLYLNIFIFIYPRSGTKILSANTKSYMVMVKLWSISENTMGSKYSVESRPTMAKSLFAILDPSNFLSVNCYLFFLTILISMTSRLVVS